jgi:20S proteasome alpha/beta subunit
MTLICAVKCKDGIVIGSDGQASIASVGGTIKHQIQKIHRIGDNTVFAASGTIGLIQKSMEIIMPHSKELDTCLTTAGLEAIKKELFPFLRGARKAYIGYNGKEEGSPTVNIVLCGLDSQKAVRIWHMAGDTHDEFIDVVGCYCSGSGETVGYALLKSFIPANCSLVVGQQVIYRTIMDTIKSLASGVGEPIDLWQMKDDGSIKQLGAKELGLLAKRYNEWKRTESGFLFNT